MFCISYEFTCCIFSSLCLHSCFMCPSSCFLVVILYPGVDVFCLWCFSSSLCHFVSLFFVVLAHSGHFVSFFMSLLMFYCSFSCVCSSLCHVVSTHRCFVSLCVIFVPPSGPFESPGPPEPGLTDSFSPAAVPPSDWPVCEAPGWHLGMRWAVCHSGNLPLCLEDNAWAEARTASRLIKLSEHAEMLLWGSSIH